MRLTNHSRTLAMSFSSKRGFHLKRHSNFPLQFSVSMLFYNLLVRGTSTKIIRQFKRKFLLLLFAAAPISLEEESKTLPLVYKSVPLFLGKLSFGVPGDLPAPPNRLVGKVRNHILSLQVHVSRVFNPQSHLARVVVDKEEEETERERRKIEKENWSARAGFGALGILSSSHSARWISRGAQVPSVGEKDRSNGTVKVSKRKKWEEEKIVKSCSITCGAQDPHFRSCTRWLSTSSAQLLSTFLKRNQAVVTWWSDRRKRKTQVWHYYPFCALWEYGLYLLSYFLLFCFFVRSFHPNIYPPPLQPSPGTDGGILIRGDKYPSLPMRCL